MADNPHSRDTALARMLAEALKARGQGGPAGNDSVCPDAEILAAYAERVLTQEEFGRWETHLADCDRCQKILAVLTASADELSDAEVQRLGTIIATSATPHPVAREHSKFSAIWHRPQLWGWLVPAVGTVAVVTLWLVIYQTPPKPVMEPQAVSATSDPGRNATHPAPPSTTPNQGSAAVASAPAAQQGETQRRQARPSISSAPGANERAPMPQTNTIGAGESPNAVAAAPVQAPQKQDALRNAPAAASPPEADRALDALSASAAKKSRAPVEQTTPAKNEAGDAQRSATLGAPAVAAPAAPPQQPAPAASPLRDRESAAFSSSPKAQMQGLMKTAPVTIVFSSANRTSLWRIGPAGRIEYSADQSQTWHPQMSGVNADLIAGAAPSDKVGWVVGRSGTILRTEDAQHWQRVTPPAPPGGMMDWIGIEARDALHATITSSDQRRFTTEDGGQTWVQQR